VKVRRSSTVNGGHGVILDATGSNCTLRNDSAFRNIDDVLRKEAGCTTELDYTEQTSGLLLLKYLDDLE
jgi:hypothetical protein